MQTRMTEILADPAARDAAVVAGREWGAFCAYCHGENGVDTKDWLADLAGQGARFILDQNLAYAIREREHRDMNDLAASTTDMALIKFSVHYAAHTLKHIDADMAGKVLTVGESCYQSVCSERHSNNGCCEKGYTWITGQKQEYVRRALARYRDGQDGRLDQEHIADQLIDDLAAYIATRH